MPALLFLEEASENSDMDPNNADVAYECMEVMDERKVESSVVAVCIPVPADVFVFIVP